MFKKLVLLYIFTAFLNSCATWTHNSGNDSNLANDKNFCNNYAYMVAPTYICRNITYCQPDETNIALQALTQNTAAFRHCMFRKDYREAN